MKCPVCKATIPALQEGCNACGSYWREGQKDCPAIFISTYGDVDAVCQLPFRHNDLKHKAMGVEVGDIEMTILWHYPRNSKFHDRSKDYEGRAQRED